MYTTIEADANKFIYSVARSLCHNINNDKTFDPGDIPGAKAVIRRVGNEKYIIAIADPASDAVKFVKFEAIAD